MRLAILTQYYPPETGAPQNRLSDLAARLAGRGHAVEVLTALPSYPGDAIFPEWRGRENTTETVDGVRVSRVGLYVPPRKTFARRLANYGSFAWNALRHGPTLLSRADVLLMESPPLFLAPSGVRLARRLGARFVVNVSDLWPQSAVALGMIGPGPALWAAERLEAWMYRSAALVLGQTDGILDGVRARSPGVRAELYPNGVDTAGYAGPFDTAAVRREFGWAEGDFVVGYTGILGHAQALSQVLDAARLTAGGDAPAVRFALFGDGPVREALADRIASEGLRHVALHDRQPSSRMPEIQAAFDAGLVPLARAKLFEGARPSKMFEMMASGRPTIVCARGEAERVLAWDGGAPAGIAVPPEDPPSLAAAIRDLASDRDRAAAMGRRGREIVLAHFDRAAIAERVERLLLEAVGR